MPVWLTWNVVKYAAIALVIGGGLFYVKHVYDQAQRVPGLVAANKEKQKKLDYFAGRTVVINSALIRIQGERDAYHDQIKLWAPVVQNASDALKKDRKNAKASTLAVCFPTDAERELRNSIVNSLRLGAGRATETSGLPPAK